MNEHLPAALREAQAKGVDLFMGEACEWKLAPEVSAKFIEKIVGAPVFVFANNGFGDHLFLKKSPSSDGFDDAVFEFLHEGPEIVAVAERLEVLLGLVARPPSADAYPKAVYESGEPVQLEDRVQLKVWAEFWKGWQDGVVKYVPGISKKKPRHEFNGLKWVAIKFGTGEICPLVDPETGKLRKVRFVRRR
jgi:hypothetical protein